MASTQIAICDDDEGMRQHLQRLVLAQGAVCDIHLYQSGEAVLSAGRTFDILFLDIQMDTLSGLQTAAQIRRREVAGGLPKSVIIFVTGLPGHMQEAFDVNAYHYLVKPLDEDKFSEVFEKAIGELATRAAAKPEYIILRGKKSTYNMALSEILYVESRNKKVEIHSINEMVVHYATMNEMQRHLVHGFFRCHRCYLVNMAHIRRYSASEIELSNDAQIPLAQKKYAAFLQAYMSYVKDSVSQ